MADGQVWLVAAQGGHLTSPELSRKVRKKAQPLLRFRQFVRPEEEFGANRGDTLQFTKVGNVLTKGRKIAETETVPVTRVTIFKDSLTVDEFGNSIEYTWKLELLAKLDINSIIIQALKDDMAIVLDEEAGNQFLTADLVYTPTGTELDRNYVLNTNGTPGTSTRPMSVWDLKNIADIMKATYHIPLFDGSNYMCVATTTHCRSIKDDSEWVEAVKYGDPARLFTGEQGRIYGVRSTEETNLLNGNLAGGLGQAVYFGADAVVEIAAYPEEIQAKIGADYGRDKGIRWVWVGGSKKTWSFATESEARMILVSSNS